MTSNEKTHIRVRVPVEIDTALQRAMPERAGHGQAEARVLIAVAAYLASRGADVVVSLPAPPARGSSAGGWRRAARPVRAHARRAQTRRARRRR